MLAPQRPSRRRPLFFVGAIIAVYLIISLGPPIFTPITVSGPLSYVDRASQWASSLRSVAPPHQALPSQTTPLGAPGNASFPTTNSQQQVLQSPAVWPKIRQATIVYDGDKDGLRDVYVKGLDSHVAHGEKWGMPTHVLRESLVEDRSDFNKPAWLMHIIMGELSRPQKERSEWVVWFDADSIILNPQIPYSLFLPPPDFSDKHIIATRDINGFDAGMLFLRVDPWTIKMLSLVISLPSFEPDTPLPLFDQSAIDNICSREGFKEHFLYQPRRWWNRYQQDVGAEEKGNFLIHFTGTSTAQGGSKQKKDIMAHLIESVAKNPSEWNVPVTQTGLEIEVKEYWERLRVARKALEKAKGMVQGLGKEEVLIGKMKEKDANGRESTMKAEGGVESKFFRLVDLVLKGADDGEEMDLGIKALEGAMGGESGLMAGRGKKGLR